MNFKPMLAEKASEHEIRFPLFASAKLDGLRGVVVEGKIMTRNMKPFGNDATREFFSHPALNGLDGELIVGDPTSKECFARSTSGLRNSAFDPRAVFYVFDIAPQIVGVRDAGFSTRHAALVLHVNAVIKQFPQFAGRLRVLEQWRIERLADLLAFEQATLAQGYEGLILRSIDGPYKMGRATVAQGWMLKLKRFTDAEADLLGIIEQQHNMNAAFINEVGRSARSSEASGKRPAGVMGALLVRDRASGAIFTVGTGFDDAQRREWWSKRKGAPQPVRKVNPDHSPAFECFYACDAALIKYKFFAVGSKDAPRHPVFLGERWLADA